MKLRSIESFEPNLQHSGHPLEALLLAAVRPLLRHHADPLVPQHLRSADQSEVSTRSRDRSSPPITAHLDAEHGDAAAVDEAHGLHRQHRRDDVVRVVLAAAHLRTVRASNIFKVSINIFP